MDNFFLSFHHLGLAVKTAEKSIAFLKKNGYSIGPLCYDLLQNVNLHFCTHPCQPNIEIIFPSNTPGPLDTILKNTEQSFYHICYSTKDLTLSLKSFKDDKIRLITISSPKPAILFCDAYVSFYYVPGFGIIEIIETDKV